MKLGMKCRVVDPSEAREGDFRPSGLSLQRLDNGEAHRIRMGLHPVSGRKSPARVTHILRVVAALMLAACLFGCAATRDITPNVPETAVAMKIVWTPVVFTGGVVTWVPVTIVAGLSASEITTPDWPNIIGWPFYVTTLLWRMPL
jgi:hypothetical protein